VWHIGVGTQIEYDAPATLWAMVEPLGNNQDGLLHPSAVADVMGLISSFSKEIRQLLDGMAQNHEIASNSIEPISIFCTDEIRYALE
jgi:hypothetical protein